MRFFRSLAGVTLLVLLTGAKVEAVDFKLYEHIKESVTKETMPEKADEEIVPFLTRIAKQDTIDVQEEEVRAALEKRRYDFCTSGPLSETSIGMCPFLYTTLHELAMKAEDIRALGRELLLIAASYESGVDGFMEEPLEFANKLPGIRHLWIGTNDHIFTPVKSPLLRAAARPSGVTDEMFSRIDSVLYLGEGNIRTAAVWRYRYGIAAFEHEGGCDDNAAGNAELQELTVKRWCQLEQALTDIRNALPSSADGYDPPLKDGEIVTFPPKRLEQAEHVIVWMKAENQGGRVTKDVGLGWDLPVDPVLPGLTKDPNAGDCMGEIGKKEYCDIVRDFDVLPGGLYPDPPKEPEADHGLCNLPFAHDGYLCRPMELEACSQALDAYRDPRSIVLTRCQPEQFKEPTRITESGPDVCATGWWRIPTDNEQIPRDTAERNPDLRPDSCSNCVVDLYCGGGCEEGQTAFTSPKDENGVIKICIATSTPRVAIPFIILHELTHAQQLCPLLSDRKVATSKEECCAREREAYMVSCRAEADMGLLDKASISIDECASAYANTSCGDYGDNACSNMDSRALMNRINALLEEEGNAHPDAPSCEDILNNLASKEPRAAAMKESLKNVCSPNCRSRYENSIGNNMCFLGGCIEQSVEESRLIPGRMALGAEDESSPWDACAAPDPRNDTVLAVPTFAPPLPPPYNPLLLIESLDRALCQLNGLPALTPPVLCQFNTQRRAGIPLMDYLSTTISLKNQTIENRNPMLALQQMTQSIATRIGTDMFAEYLRWAGRNLADTLRAANQLLGRMADARLPLTMCPRNAAREESLCETLNTR